VLHRFVGPFSTSRGPWLAGAVGVVLCMPAIGAGLVGDDYLWWLILEREGPLGQGLPPLLHVYNFIPGGLETEVLKGAGMLTWWSDPELSIALCRPLTVLTYLLDHAIAPRGFALQHLHSLAWYGLCVVLVGVMYRRVHPEAGAVAGLAMLLFAVEDAHAMPAGWLANRHALLSLVVAVGAFLAHVEWRKTARVRWLVAAVGMLVAGLLCGEATLGIVAYVVAWQLTLDRGRWSARLLAVAPYAVTILGWRLVYDHLGYGITGSGLYLDPVRDPWEFGLALLWRWPVLQLGQWLQAPVDVIISLPPASHVVILTGALAACLGLGWFFLPLLRRSPQARFWALGMAFALVPLCAAFPMDRHTIFAGVGAFGLLAVQADALGWLSPPRAAPGSRVRRWLTCALLVLHLPVAAVLLLGRTASLPLFGAFFAAGADTAPESPGVEEQTFLFVSGHEFPVAYIPIIRSVEGCPAPRRIALLASFTSRNRIAREDEDTLVIEPEWGFLAEPSDRLERRLKSAFREGERVWMPDFVAEVREVTPDGRPRVVAFHFRKPLEDPGHGWMSWGLMGAEPFTVPAVGETVVSPALPLTAIFPARPGDER